jgi:sugar/nucleoside kinase (ribokinase family)
VQSIALAGHLCLDIQPRLAGSADLTPGRLFEVGPLNIRPGGSVANAGRVLAGLGAAVIPYASVGDDELGSLLLAGLQREGLQAPRLTTSSGSTTSYSLVLESDGADRTFWHHTGANDEFDGTQVDVAGFSLLHFGYPSLLPAMLPNHGQPLRDLLGRARAAGVTTSLDLAVVDPESAVGALDWQSILRRAVGEADIVSPSLDDLTSALRIDEQYSPALVERLAIELLEEGAAVVAISAGRHGLHLRTGSVDRLRAGGRLLAPIAEAWADRSLNAPALKGSRPLTTNGAGDASSAGLLFAMLQGASPKEAARLATVCAAVVMGGDRTTRASISTIDPSLEILFDHVGAS